MTQDWQCRRCGRREPRLTWAPWPGEVGKLVVSSVCDICWKEWMGMQTKIINEYRLNVLEPEHARLLREQMLTFLGLAGGEGAPPMPTP